MLPNRENRQVCLDGWLPPRRQGFEFDVLEMMDTLQPGLSKYIKDEMTRVSLLGYQSLAPSPSTITRYKLSLDVGYMVYRAAHAHEREEASIYMLADSSPQLRHDFVCGGVHRVGEQICSRAGAPCLDRQCP